MRTSEYNSRPKLIIALLKWILNLNIIDEVKDNSWWLNNYCIFWITCKNCIFVAFRQSG